MMIIDIGILGGADDGNGTVTSASATNGSVFNSPLSDAIQPEDLVAVFDEAEDAIDIDEEDSNRPDLEGNDADDPQTKKHKNKAKRRKPTKGIRQT